MRKGECLPPLDSLCFSPSLGDMSNTIQDYTPQTQSESPLSSILSTPGLTLEKLPHEQPAPLNAFTFPQDIYNQLDGVDFRLLEEIDYLSRCQAKHGKTGARYCFPSEAYLAQKLSRCREVISRHVSKLSRLGVLSVIHRRKVRGHWQTNLYRIVSSVWWRIRKGLGKTISRDFSRVPPAHKRRAKILADSSTNPHRVTFPSHIADPMRVINNSPTRKTLKAHVDSILQTWMKRGETQKDAA